MKKVKSVSLVAFLFFATVEGFAFDRFEVDLSNKGHTLVIEDDPKELYNGTYEVIGFSAFFNELWGYRVQVQLTGLSKWEPQIRDLPWILEVKDIDEDWIEKFRAAMLEKSNAVLWPAKLVRPSAANTFVVSGDDLPISGESILRTPICARLWNWVQE